MKLDWRPLAPGDGPAISTSLTENEAATLAELAAGKQVVEVGSAYGFSAIKMALAGAHVLAIDPHGALNSYQTMLDNIAAYGVQDRISIRKTWSGTLMPWLKRLGEKFDVVWIDGDHEQPAVIADVEMALPLLTDDGILAIHDYHEATCPGVALALDAWIPPTHIVDTLAIYGPDQWRQTA